MSLKSAADDYKLILTTGCLVTPDYPVMIPSIVNMYLLHERSHRQLNAQLTFFAETGDDYFSRENGGQNQNRGRFRNSSGPTFRTRIKHKNFSVNFVLQIMLLS